MWDTGYITINIVIVFAFIQGLGGGRLSLGSGLAAHQVVTYPQVPQCEATPPPPTTPMTPSSIAKLPPAFNSLVPIYTPQRTWVQRRTVRVKCHA